MTRLDVVLYLTIICNHYADGTIIQDKLNMVQIILLLIDFLYTKAFNILLSVYEIQLVKQYAVRQRGIIRSINIRLNRLVNSREIRY